MQISACLIAEDNVCQFHWDKAGEGCFGGRKFPATATLEVPRHKAGTPP